MCWLDAWFVSHEKGTAHLQYWDFNWEVEWSNNTNTSEWESVTGTELSRVITWHLECFSCKSNIISTKVLNEVSCNSQFSNSLMSAFRCASNNIINEEVENFWVIQYLSSLSHNLSEHYIPLLILKWIVKSTLRSVSQTLNKWVDLVQ